MIDHLKRAVDVGAGDLGNDVLLRIVLERTVGQRFHVGLGALRIVPGPIIEHLLQRGVLLLRIGNVLGQGESGLGIGRRETIDHVVEQVTLLLLVLQREDVFARRLGILHAPHADDLLLRLFFCRGGAELVRHGQPGLRIDTP